MLCAASDPLPDDDVIFDYIYDHVPRVGVTFLTNGIRQTGSVQRRDDA